jgi:hypothetical protein
MAVALKKNSSILFKEEIKMAPTEVRKFVYLEKLINFYSKKI